MYLAAGVQHLEDLLVLRWLRYGSSIQQGKGRDIIVLYLLYIWCSSAATRVLLHTVCLRLALLFLIAGPGSCSQNSATEATIYSMGWEVLKVLSYQTKGWLSPITCCWGVRMKSVVVSVEKEESIKILTNKCMYEEYKHPWPGKQTKMC